MGCLVRIRHRRQDPMLKRWPSKLFNTVTRWLARVDLHDFNCGFKLYRREVLEQISIYGELHRYIPVLASRQGFKIGEIRVPHERRRHGASKYGFDRFYKGLTAGWPFLGPARATKTPCPFLPARFAFQSRSLDIEPWNLGDPEPAPRKDEG